jgi:hypothetical protein
VGLIENGWTVPRDVPFSVLEEYHRFEVMCYYNFLLSAKDFDTFYSAAVYLRPQINQYLFTYVLSVALYQRPDTQGMYVPPAHQVYPTSFYNSEVMAIARKVSSYDKKNIEYFPSTFMWNDNVVIRWNETLWSYFSREQSMAYYTHDLGLNDYYYNDHILYPYWLGADANPSLVKDNRGERFWFNHKYFLARYYMERLSNGLGEIPNLGLDVLPQGYSSGLAYDNGIQFPVRPNYFYLQQPWFVNEIKEIVEYESRVMEAIDKGYVESVSIYG